MEKPGKNDPIPAERLVSYWDSEVACFQTTKYKISGKGCAMLAKAFDVLSKSKEPDLYRFSMKCGETLVVVHCGRVEMPKSVAGCSLAGWIMTGHAKEEGNQYDWNLYVANDEVGFRRLSILTQERISCDGYLWIDNHTQIQLGIRGDFGIELELDCSGIGNTLFGRTDWLRDDELPSKSFRMKYVFEQYSFGGL